MHLFLHSLQLSLQQSPVMTHLVGRMPTMRAVFGIGITDTKNKNVLTMGGPWGRQMTTAVTVEGGVKTPILQSLQRFQELLRARALLQ